MRRTLLLSLAALSLLFAAPARAQDAVCAKVKLVIPQKLTFERDAFDAMLTLTNNLGDAALDDLSVAVELRQMNGTLAEEQFFVSVSSLDNVTGIDGGGLILPNEKGTIHWLLIPSAGAGGTLPGGINYRVKAKIVYTVNGQPFDLETLEETITVKPQPLLVLDYFLPQRVWGDDPFTLELEPLIPYELAVRVSNIGWGAATNLKIASAQPVIVENDKGLLIDFKIIGTWLDGKSISKSLAILFGNLGAQSCGTGAWAMTSSLQGTFTELAVSFSHKDELGGDKTSLVEEANSHWLVHMVQLDSAGKDAKPDLLAYEIGQPEGVPTTIYESDCGESPVAAVPAAAAGQPSLLDNTATLTATLQSGWCWASAPDPASGAYPILKVIRDSDGKTLNARNAWITLDPDRAPYVELLDWSTLGPVEQSYTIYYDLSEFDATPPISTLTFVGPHAGVSPVVVSPFTIMNTTATDDMAGVAKRELRKDGGAWESAAPFFFQAPGEHLLEYRATDNKGNVEATRVAQIVVDAQKPTVTAISPLPGETYHLTQPLSVDADVTDLDPAPKSTASLISLDTAESVPVTLGTVVDITQLMPGDWNLVVVATDWMGNSATAVIGPFTLDEYVPPPPVVTLTGVSPGAFSAVPVAVIATVEPPDAALALTLDGAPYVPGTLVSADGVHMVEAVATDAWDQIGQASVSFVLDQTAPQVIWSGVSPGQIAGAPVTPVLSVVEPNLATQAVTLDGQAFTSGSVVAAEGPHAVSATVVDLAGNTKTASVEFTVDLTAPAIAIEGVEDGVAYAVPVAVDVTITDLTLTASSITLDGAPYLSGTLIDGEGPHVLAVEASDAVGRTTTAEVSFLVDLTAPAITVDGVEDGAAYAEAVTPTISIVDDNLVESAITLDGQPFVSGTDIGDPGDHTLLVTAVDAAGSSAELTVSFSIDLDAPLITVTGVSSGAFYNAPVTPIVTVVDTDLDTVTTTLDDAPFESGTPIDAEGPHVLRVVATDTAGNESIKPVSFTVDLTPPSVLISGVSEGVVYGEPVVPAATVTDQTAVVVVRTLDGLPHTSGAAVSAEGPHDFAVSATDKAGNQASAQVHFIIDLTAPQIAVTGVLDGEWSPVALTPEIEVTDDSATDVTVTLDGAPFEPGTSVTGEGAHTLVVSATDAGGNQASVTVGFGVDTTSPAVAITGVQDGGLYGTPVLIGWTIDEAHPKATVATLDGSATTDGQTVSAEGPHTLIVTVTDLAGNQGSAQVTFTLDLTAPVVTLGGVTSGAVVGAPPTVTVTVDDEAATVIATLDGQPWTPGAPIAGEGEHTVVATATDAAGNSGQASVTFTVDTIQPDIALSGVTDGGIYGAGVTPTFTVTDATDTVLGAVLDGEPFASGTLVDGEGAHVLFIQATDAAGNQASVTVSFVVDQSAPLIQIDGVTDGEWYPEPVTPTVQTDAGGASIEATLDDAPWELGAPIDAEGWHELAVTVTDGAGNVAKESVSFGVDLTAPAITIEGILDGDVVASATPVVTVADDHLDGATITLDDAPFASGTTITAAGPHTLAVAATDLAGNESTAEIAFVVDPDAPEITLTGVQDGAFYAAPVTIGVEVQAIAEVTTVLTLDGAPIEAGTVVAAEGQHLARATVTSETGAVASVSATFVVDLTAPAIAILGVTEGGAYQPGVAPEWTVDDAWLGAGVATLDGAPATSGAPILAEGAHVLRVAADDLAGNHAAEERGFIVDGAAPEVSIAGVDAGAVVHGPVTLTAQASDGASVVMMLDGEAYEPGAPIAAEGDHQAEATATSPAGVAAKATLSFTIDVTPPVITITGVDDGGTYDPPVTAAVEFDDDHPGTTTVTLDGAPFDGAPIEAPGAHALHAEATDLAGNTATADASFTITAPPGPLVVRITRDGAPVTDARVLLLHADGSYAGQWGTLDAAGTWTADALAEGGYRVRVDRLWRRFLSPTADWPAQTELAWELPAEPMAETFLHVRSDSPTSGDGSQQKPFRSLADALSGASFGTLVRVAGGVYEESVLVPDGVSVVGGFDADTWLHDPGAQTTLLLGQGDAPVVRFDGALHGELADVTVRGGGGVALTDSSPLLRNLIVEECGRSDGACLDQQRGEFATFVNLLVVHNAGQAAVALLDAPTHLWNVTIADNASVGLLLTGSLALVERGIIARNDAAAVDATDSDGARVERSLIWGNGAGAVGVALDAVVEQDPLFVTGPLHAHYLSQVAAGDLADSPALDAGGVDVGALELAPFTTASSGAPDQGVADLGFHAWPAAPIAPPEDIGGSDAGGSDAGGSDAGGSDAGVEDVAAPPVDGGADVTSVDAGDATGGDAGGDPAAGGCGSCAVTDGGVALRPGDVLLLALLLLGVFGLRRSRRRAALADR